uniref:hypothetical protein n=1 Tax=Enterocloster clostridioformis TaxID=1531 RepID=UPI0026F35A8A|nr:hypothetical protein [Enterocloster clostridioformis]
MGNIFPFTPYNTGKEEIDGNFQNFFSLFSNTGGKGKRQKWAQKKQQIFSDLLLVVPLAGGKV